MEDYSLYRKEGEKKIYVLGRDRFIQQFFITESIKFHVLLLSDRISFSEFSFKNLKLVQRERRECCFQCVCNPRRVRSRQEPLQRFLPTVAAQRTGSEVGQDPLVAPNLCGPIQKELGRVQKVGKRDKLKLKVIVLHDGIGKEVHMTQPVWFAAKDLVPVA